MSSTDDTTRDWRDSIGSDRRLDLGRVRRMAVKLTSGAFWQAVGHLLLDSRTRETVSAEVFGAIGFHSRPAAGANAEVVVVFPGGAANPVIVATRDEDLRRAMGDLDQDQTAMFNRIVTVLCKGSTVEVRTAVGVVQPTLLGTTYRVAEDLMLTALAAAFTALGSVVAIGAPAQAACSAAAAAITTFQTGASGYLSQVLKIQ